MRRLVRLASDALAMLAVGSGTGPVPDSAHGAAGEHQRDCGVTREDGEDRADDDAEHHEPDMEGVPGVCHIRRLLEKTYFKAQVPSHRVRDSPFRWVLELAV